MQRGRYLVTAEPSRDIGTTLPRFVERVCGGRPIACPWHAFADPFVTETIRLRRAFERGAINLLSLPAVMVEAIQIYDAALRRLEADDDRREREERERKRRQAEAAAQSGRPDRPRQFRARGA